MNKREDFYSDVIIGMSDGLIVPFALVAGLSTIVSSSSIIVIAGLTAIIAGAIAMSVGGYRATKSESVYHHDEEAEHKEVLKEKEFLANIGLSEEMQQMALEEMKKDKEQWTGFVTKYEEDNSTSADGRAARSAINIGISYTVGGLVPVIPYFFMTVPTEALKVTTIITLICLFLFGYLKHKSLGNHPFWGALRMLLAGALAAGAALGVALLVK